MSIRGRLSSTKVADSDTSSGSFSVVAQRFAGTRRLGRNVEIAPTDSNARWVVCRLSEFGLFAWNGVCRSPRYATRYFMSSCLF